MPSTSTSTILSFCSQASCQYFPHRFCNVHERLVITPNSAIIKDRSGRKFCNAAYAKNAAAINNQKKFDLCQKRSISKRLTSLAYFKRMRQMTMAKVCLDHGTATGSGVTRPSITPLLLSADRLRSNFVARRPDETEDHPQWTGNPGNVV